MTRSRWNAPVAFALFLVGCEAPPPPTLDEEGAHTEAVTLWTSALELFMEYPTLIAGRASEPWAIHLTTLADFQPVQSGTLTLTFAGPDGRNHEVVEEAPTRPGIYGPTVALPTAGSYDLTMTLAAAGGRHEIWVGPVFVYGSASELPTVAPEPETGIVLLKEQQWVVPFATTEAMVRAVAEAVPVPGELLAPDGGMIALTAPLAGLLTPAANAAAPSVGARVRRGQVLAVLTSADGESSWSALVARVEHAEREAARMERLHAAEAIPTRRLEEARHELTVARRSLEALGVSADSGAALRVRSPIDGVVVSRNLMLGARVDAGAPLFVVADTRTLWVRFRLSVSQAGRLAEVQGANFSVEGSDLVYRAGRPVSATQVVDPGTRSIAVTFGLANPGGDLRAGMLARGHLLMGAGVEGTAVPVSAIRMEDGVAVAYVQVGGELFQRRVLAVGPSDGEWVLVTSGVTAGERVVVTGAYQVRLASLNPAAVSDHGHPH
ncbi:MAG: efflux RND transporter periplasmic adaptor subunit [Gemmatimonadales bacterium]